jgi:hypothetical protein
VTSRQKVSAPLKLQSDRIHNVHLQGDQQTSRTLVPAEDDQNCLKLREIVRWYAPQSRRSKAHRTTNVHRITKHVEWEALDAGIHKDSEIIAQEGARDTK